VRPAALPRVSRSLPAARWPLGYAFASAAFFVVQVAGRQQLGAGDVVVMLLLSAPLALQRDRPLLTICALMAGLCLLNAAVIDSSDLTAVFMLVFGPAFCLGRHETRGRMLLGLLAYLAGFTLAETLSPAFDPGAYAAIAFFVLPSIALGRGVRTRTALVDELAAVNEGIAAEREARAHAAAEQERARVARELHDIVAHALSVMVLQATGARLAVARDPGAAEHALGVVAHAGADAVAETHRLLGVLRGHGDVPAAGLARIETLVERARSAGLDLEVSLEGESRGLPPTLDLAAYRIAQEAVTNAVKHAAPTRARLRVSVGADALEVVVEDDGRADAARPGPGTGNGLLGMRERVELHGGKVEAAERAGGGFRVRAWLPTS
jgi:signal transduction histidine kinase